MATRGYIAIENKDGSVDYTSVRSDGYNLGKTLLNRYSDKDKLSKLIQGGWIYHLGSEFDPKKIKEISSKEFFKSEDYNYIGRGLTLSTYDLCELKAKTGISPDYFYKYIDLPTWEDCKPGCLKDFLFFKEHFKNSWAYLYTKHNEWWVSPYSEDYKNTKWKKLKDHLKEVELEEWFVDSLHVYLKRKPKFSTFPELDSNLDLKEEFFHWILELSDLRDAKSYLKNFPYSKMRYFKDLCDLKNFAFDFFKDKRPHLFEDTTGDYWFMQEDKSLSLTFKAIKTLCDWCHCELFGNEKIGFLFFDFKQQLREEKQ